MLISVLHMLKKVVMIPFAHNFLSTFSSTRRRFVKEKKVPASKIEKLLDVFPQVIFSSGMTRLVVFPSERSFGSWEKDWFVN